MDRKRELQASKGPDSPCKSLSIYSSAAFNTLGRIIFPHLSDWTVPRQCSQSAHGVLKTCSISQISNSGKVTEEPPELVQINKTVLDKRQLVKHQIRLKILIIILTWSYHHVRRANRVQDQDQVNGLNHCEGSIETGLKLTKDH